MSVNNNLLLVKTSISECEKKFNRKENSVKLIAVSKFHPADAVFEAIDAGQNVFGENRVQEAAEKFSIVKNKNPNVELHIIGQLQTNKVKKAVEIANCIQSVDRIDLLREIEKQCSKIDKQMDILFEVHTGEDSKSGYTSEEELIQSLQALKNGEFPHVNPKGFMTMAPFTEDTNLIRNSFRQLRLLADKMQNMFPMYNLVELSMGMSGDYEIAIEEGATMVRIGTSIFGERDYSKK